MVFACVLRDLSDGTGKQYVPVGEVPSLDVNETAYVARWNVQQEKHGPYGSHVRSVCLPLTQIATLPVAELLAARSH